jgi:hypothetical protein
MKLGLSIGYSGAELKLPLEKVQLAERLGFDSVWTAEAYGSDAITPLAYLAAVTTRIRLGTGIMQLAARPPATAAMAAECREGVPAGSPMDKLLRSASSPEEILTLLSTPGFVRPEQWQAQIQSLIQRKASVLVHSSLPDEIIRSVHLTPCRDISAKVNELLRAGGKEARLAVLPQGPLTIPYLAE